MEAQLPFYSSFGPDELEEFHARLKTFVWGKTWIGASGFEITDEVRVTIAGVATRLALYLSRSSYDRLSEIVVYPSHYKHPDSDAKTAVFGEAHNWGVVVLSWDAVVAGLKNAADGHDTATHEFAHVLDRNSGAFDGTPPLRAREDYRPWAEILSHHFFRLQDRKKTERAVMDIYGATNEAEFFAVATESFFEKPASMAKKTPDLYRVLARFYGVDPANVQRVEESKDD